MIRANSSVQIQKLQIPNQQISPFNAQIRYSNPYSDTPSTPQRSFIGQQIRSSATITPNKTQQTFYFKETNQSIEYRIQQLVNENMYLNQELERTQFELKQQQQSHDQLNVIKERMTNLEQLIDQQTIEIEEWKQKYHKASTGETGIEITQMEQQIINVIQENERLNASLQEMISQQQETEQRHTSLLNTIQKQENEIKKQKEKINIFEKSNNKLAIQWNAFQSDKKNQKIVPSNDQNKIKFSEQENNIRKKSDHLTKTNNIQIVELIQQITELKEENELLKSKLDSNKQIHQNNTNSNDLLIIKQEISNQQILIAEIKKLKSQLIQNYQYKQDVEQILQIVNKMTEYEKIFDCFSDQTIDDLQLSQNNCLTIIEKFKKQ